MASRCAEITDGIQALFNESNVVRINPDRCRQRRANFSMVSHVTISAWSRTRMAHTSRGLSGGFCPVTLALVRRHRWAPNDFIDLRLRFHVLLHLEGWNRGRSIQMERKREAESRAGTWRPLFLGTCSGGTSPSAHTLRDVRRLAPPCPLVRAWRGRQAYRPQYPPGTSPAWAWVSPPTYAKSASADQCNRLQRRASPCGSQ